MPPSCDEILEAYELPLLRYFAALIGRAVVAEELLVDTVEAVEILRGSAGRGASAEALSPRARIFAIARELAIEELRTRAERAAEPIGSTARSPIRAALARIPLPAREALCLKIFGELSAAEIARILRVDEGRVERWLRAGLLELAETLPPEIATDPAASSKEERHGVR